VIDGFREAVGPGGTVVVPTFTLLGRVGPFGSWYDHDASPSTVGLITETLRRRPEAVRSFHPIHSVAAVGRRADEVTAGHRHARGRVSPWCDAAFAHQSPFDLLARWDAWYVLLGVGFEVQTIMHYVETVLVDAVLQRAPAAARAALTARVRRWGAGGVWASLDRIPLGEALLAGGTYATTTVGQATVRGARFRAVLRDTFALVLGAPEAWLNPAFREWMGDPPAPGAVLEAYTAPEGLGPPAAAPAAPAGGPDVTCAGLTSETSERARPSSGSPS
jgi:aminoglycoside N3'-acetyltransferase